MSADNDNDGIRKFLGKLPGLEFLGVGVFIIVAGFFMLMGQFKDVPEEINWRGPGFLMLLGLAVVVAYFIRLKNVRGRQRR